jgi:hypothetical protein
MGRYTELARRLRDDGPQDEGSTSTDTILNVNIDSIHSNRDSRIDKPTSGRPEDTLKGFAPVDSSQSCTSVDKDAALKAGEHDTNLRTTNLTNLTEPERCMHEMAPKKCAVCNGYARWLIAGGAARIAQARSSPEGTRRLYWQLIDGGKV